MAIRNGKTVTMHFRQIPMKLKELLKSPCDACCSDSTGFSSNAHLLTVLVASSVGRSVTHEDREAVCGKAKPVQVFDAFTINSEFDHAFAVHNDAMGLQCFALPEARSGTCSRRAASAQLYAW